MGHFDGNFDDFSKDLEENKRDNSRAGVFKLKNGDNPIVILTNPIGFSEVFNIGIAFEGCGYGEYTGRRYKCYVKDMKDGEIKVANFSYTLAGKISELGQGARTKFDKFPMPYVINLQTKNAGQLTVETSVITGEDYTMTDEDMAKLNEFAPIQDILDRLKQAQRKKIAEDPELRQKIADFIDGKKKEKEERDEKIKKNRDKDTNLADRSQGLDTIEYPEDDVNLEDIPF